MGERDTGVLRLNFCRLLRLELDGSKVASGAGLLPYRELMAFQARTDCQNHAIGWLQRGYSPLGAGTVV